MYVAFSLSELAAAVKVCCIVTLTTAATSSAISKRIEDSFDLSKKTVVFVSGFPQSGTSLLQQIFTITPYVSTMVNICDKSIGEKCKNWNYEGQWLLEASREISATLNPGSFCLSSSNRTITESTRNSIISQWTHFWSKNASILVEKSPQSIVKMQLLRDIFARKARRLKFLVVIKHPATLNIALPRGVSWADGAYSTSGVTAARSSSGISSSFDKKMTYFSNFLDNGDSWKGQSHSCNSGWLETLNRLHTYLSQEARELSRIDTRILRFEDLDRPLLVCRELLRFIFDIRSGDEVLGGAYNAERNRNSSTVPGDFDVEVEEAEEAKVRFTEYNHAIQVVCQKSLGNVRPASTSGSPPHLTGAIRDRRGNGITKARKMTGQKESGKSLGRQIVLARRGLRCDEHIRVASSNRTTSTQLHHRYRRKLRYRIDQPELQLHAHSRPSLIFRPEVVTQAKSIRFKDFGVALQQCCADKLLKRRLLSLEQLMNRYGYGFKQYRTKTSVLDDWDILKRYKQ